MELISISKIKLGKRNPRKIKADKLDALVISLVELPQMLSARPIVVNESLEIIGGEQRFRALKRICSMSETELYLILTNLFGESGSADKSRFDKSIAVLNEWRATKKIPVRIAEGWDADETREFVIKDNAHFGEWDAEILKDSFSDLPIEDWGADDLNIFDDEEQDKADVELDAWMNKPVSANTANTNDTQDADHRTINRGEFDPSYSAVNANINNETTYITISCSQDSKTRWRKLLKARQGQTEDELFKELLNAISQY